MDPATLTALGTAASGVGSLLGGVFGGKKSSGPSLQEQSAAALGHERDSFNQKMSLAQQHGIHPLAMMGVPMTTFAPAISSGSESGPDFSQIGYGASQIAKSFVKPPEQQEPAEDPRQSRLIDANVRLAEANAKRAEWDALRSEFGAVDMITPILTGQPGNPPRIRQSNDVSAMTSLAAAQAGVPKSYFGGQGAIELKQEVLPPHPSVLGHAAGADQSFIRGVDNAGNFYSVLNPKLIQAEFEDGATITALSKIFGPERAIEIAAILEQKGIIGGVAAAAAAAGKLGYDYFARQRADAFKRRRYGPGLGRGSWRAAPRSSD